MKLVKQGYVCHQTNVANINYFASLSLNQILKSFPRQHRKALKNGIVSPNEKFFELDINLNNPTRSNLAHKASSKNY